jgi:probable DNA repair protein
MLSAGRRVWGSPDILPWSAWVERELGEARARGERMPRRLSSVEQWQQWREAVLEACAGLNILAPERLLDAVYGALELIDDYGLQFPATASAEASLLLAAREHFRRRCSELDALGSDSWVDCANWLRPSAALMLAGFAEIGPARRRWLQQHGALLQDARSPAWDSAVTHLHAAESPAAEAQAAADWCAARLTRDARSRLLLIVPRLAEQRHLWQRALSQRLDPLRVLGLTDSLEDHAPFVIEGGRALPEHPLVASALGVIALGTARISLEQLLALLRSPHLGAWDPDARLRLELWLREYGLEPVTIEGLMHQRESIERRAGATSLALLQAMQLALLANDDTRLGGGASRAEQFAGWLAACGWPGSDLTSHDQQVRQRFEALLGELATLEPATQRLSGAAAAGLLDELAAREHFEPASDDVAVTVTASLDDPIVRYDGIWVAGLTADAWPRPVQPNALIPATVQRTARLPGSAPARTLAAARALQALWPQRARDCVLSYPKSEQDLPAQPSPLLQGLAPAAPAEQVELPTWLAALPLPLQSWSELRGNPWPARRDLKGGAKLLELQALCPFRGYAELRLSAGELAVSERGVDALEHGRMLHRALELFWQQMGGSEALQADPVGAMQLAAQCATQALEQIGPAVPGSLSALLLARERERIHALLLRMIEWESARAPFRIQHLEWSTGLTLAGHRLPLRLDRVDRLDDGRLLLLDYKSGKAQPFDAFAQRPSQPQLAAYALALGAEVAGVSMLYVGREEVQVRGVADRAGRLKKLPAVPEPLGWMQLQQQWQQRLQVLAQEFIDGYAALEPQPRACERCHLQLLCRVDALTQERARDRAEQQSAETLEETPANG